MQNAKTRMTNEIRIPNDQSPAFGFRASGFIRHSGFGFVHSAQAAVHSAQAAQYPSGRRIFNCSVSPWWAAADSGLNGGA
jgi:hypothetical protein